jgi:hypothetical protein
MWTALRQDPDTAHVLLFSATIGNPGLHAAKWLVIAASPSKKAVTVTWC